MGGRVRGWEGRFHAGSDLSVWLLRPPCFYAVIVGDGGRRQWVVAGGGICCGGSARWRGGALVLVVGACASSAVTARCDTTSCNGALAEQPLTLVMFPSEAAAGH
eukprot:354448-Chlamydomonas_euryale.AAC.4